MASNTNVRGEYVGGNRWAMIVVHEDGEEWYEEWREQDCMNGQWERDNTVSNPLSYMFQRGMTKEFASSLPRYNEKEVPADFWLPQGEITAQMYQVMSQEFAHPAMAITKRVNYWKARKFAYNIQAWYILDGVKGLLAKFPGMDKPNFYSWEEFAGAMDTYFPITKGMSPVSAGTPHIYPAPTANATDTAVEALARLIAGLMLESAYGTEKSFSMETLGANATSIGVECITLPTRKAWHCDVNLFRDGVMSKGTLLYPADSDLYDPHTLTMEFIEREGPRYYYRIKNAKGNVLKSFGIERQ